MSVETHASVRIKVTFTEGKFTGINYSNSFVCVTDDDIMEGGPDRFEEAQNIHRRIVAALDQEFSKP